MSSLYTSLFNNLQKALFIVDKNYLIKECNPPAEEITGKKKKDLLGVTFTDLFFTEEHDHIEDIFRQAADTGEAADGRVFLMISGTILKQFEMHAEAFTHENETFISCQVAQSASSVETTAAASHMVNIFDSIFKDIPYLHLIADPSGIITLIRGQAKPGKEFSPAEALNKPCGEVFACAPQIASDLQTALAGKQYASTLKIEDHIFEAAYKPLLDTEGRLLGIFISLLDVTAYHRPQGELTEKEKVFGSLYKTITIGAAAVDNKGKLLAVTNEWKETASADMRTRAIALPGENVPGLCDTASLGGDDTALELTHGIKAVIEKKSAEFVYEFPRTVSGTGNWMVVEALSSERLQESAVVLLYSITDLSAIRSRLARLEQNYISLLENYSDITFSMTIDGSYATVNNAFEALLGWDRAHVIGKPFTEFLDPDDITTGYEKFHAAVRGNTVEPFEAHLKKKNGGFRRFQVNLRPLLEGDEIKGAHGVAHDITELRHAEEALRKSEEQYRSIIDTQTELVCRFLPDTTLTFVNNAYCRYYGKTKEELIGSRFIDSVPDDEHPVVLRYIRSQLTNPRKFTFERRAQLASGETRWQRWYDIPLLNDEHEVTEFQSLGVDITELKEAEAALEESEQKFRAIIENTSDVIMLYNFSGTMTYISPSVQHVLGFEPDEVLQQSTGANLIHPEDEEQLVITFSRMLAQPNSPVDFEARFSHKDGSWRTLEGKGVNRIADKNIKALILTAHDITERKAAENELRSSQDFLQRLIGNLPVGVFMKDAVTGEYLVWNKAQGRITGLPEEEVLGKVTTDLFAAEEAAQMLKQDKRTFEEQSAVEFKDNSITTPHLGKRWVHTVKVPVFDKAGEPKHILGILQDITNRKQAESLRREMEKELFRLSLVARQTTSAVTITDLDHRILWVNKAFTQMTEYTEAEAVGKFVKELLHGPATDQKTVGEIHVMLERGEDVRVRLYNYTKSRQGYWIELLMNPMLDEHGKKIGYIRVQNNITYNVRQERALKEAKEKAEELNRIKTNFLANMSHELRTPMIGVLGYAEVLKDELEDEEYKMMSEVIFSSGKKLLETLNLLLDLSRIEANKLDINSEELDIAAEIEEIAMLFESPAQKKNLYLTVDRQGEDLKATLDPRLFRDIMNNLINNAVKFTNEGGVTVRLEKQEDGFRRWVVIKVIDTGIGIPKQSLNIIFEEFRQVSEGLSRNFEGAGLGLTVSKRFVEAMAGQIFVESVAGEGTVFTVRFPSADEGKPLPGEADGEFSEEGNAMNAPWALAENLPNVLVVEDELTSINITKMFLQNVCRIDATDNGADAIIKAQEKKYAAILMDINLGSGMTGIETAQAIRRIGEYHDTPIVALTAFAMKGDKDEFLKSGCSHYLSKPFDRKTIIEFMTALLAESRSRADKRPE